MFIASVNQFGMLRQSRGLLEVASFRTIIPHLEWRKTLKSLDELQAHRSQMSGSTATVCRRHVLICAKNAARFRVGLFPAVQAEYCAGFSSSSLSVDGDDQAVRAELSRTPASENCSAAEQKWLKPHTKHTASHRMAFLGALSANRVYCPALNSRRCVTSNRLDSGRKW